MADQTDSDVVGDGVVVYMLTTVDNPYDPFTQFDEWFMFDESHGYHTCGMLDRIVRSSDDLSETDQMVATQAAIAEIVEINALGMWKRVTRQ